jgi:SAM-dependent methyltransferase
VSAARTPRRRGSAVHEGLVGARKLVGTGYLASPKLREEYTRDIAPRTEAALARILGELYGRGTPEERPTGAPPRSLPAGEVGRTLSRARSPAWPIDRRSGTSAVNRAPLPARVVDLGAGTGAVGRALRARFGERLPVIAVDVLPAPGVLRADLSTGLPDVDGRFDLVVAAHLLNELFADRSPPERVELRARRVLAWSRSLLAAGGLIVLVEPALRQTSRELLAVRDQLLAAGLEVVAPCLWRGPCPALARDRDWCHDAAPIEHGARVDYSYLVLREPSAVGTALDPGPDPTLFRIVSDPMVEKGRLRLFGCGPAGRQPLVRLDRHASPSNAPFDTLHRGDVANIAGTQMAGDGLRIAADSTVTRQGWS